MSRPSFCMGDPTEILRPVYTRQRDSTVEFTNREKRFVPCSRHPQLGMSMTMSPSMQKASNFLRSIIDRKRRFLQGPGLEQAHALSKDAPSLHWTDDSQVNLAFPYHSDSVIHCKSTLTKMAPADDPFASQDPLPRVLSIQSHVVSGYVGNKAAVFPLQLLGFDVDILPSVTLANHTGYANGAKGPRHSAEELAVWLEGLRSNGLLPGITHLLTGYIGTPGTAQAIVDALQLLRREASESISFVCDPVLGDDGKLYVHKDVVGVYKEHLLPLASLVTPNAFELGLLTGRKINTEFDAFSACDFLHETYDIPTVIVTGTRLGMGGSMVAVLVSSRKPSESPLRFALETEFLEGSFTGSGDLMTALLLAWTTKKPDDLIGACRNAMASVTAVLKRTITAPKGTGLCNKPELRLIQSQNAILCPPIELVKVRNVTS